MWDSAINIGFLRAEVQTAQAAWGVVSPSLPDLRKEAVAAVDTGEGFVAPHLQVVDGASPANRLVLFLQHGLK